MLLSFDGLTSLWRALPLLNLPPVFRGEVATTFRLPLSSLGKDAYAIESLTLIELKTCAGIFGAGGKYMFAGTKSLLHDESRRLL